ncbi:ABC transporter substrate-binding protein [Ktedonobacter sp. SOSP1-52]|uniref:metal ABC transporter solute-binding protein, Zn/Mn family n=1 Tax=Ktedonobacter sp. SOSP1-52 TaxID=2778366 RepID=UPI0019159AF8|nr:zinc ABC transporter substrate-binding protein [Ktedonobacter sp. SOSP1-52]GHO62961.1 ABC transporter substrate-binding protein [Ktedonobacter sp. SOSP1-52]
MFSWFCSLPRAACGLLLLISFLLTACGTTFSSTATSGKSNDPIQVVAAENFWGSIAAQVGGSHVHVTSILVDPNADPHSYEPTAADARTVAQAQYVIVNGAGYDPWADKLLQANPVSGRKELNVGDFNGKHEGDNPHMWYNPDYVTAVANKIGDDLKAIDPADASAFDQSAQAFLTTGLKQYHDLIAAIKTKYSGTPVGATESLFSYLASALGLNLITPYSYLKAVSEGTDISAGDQATVAQQIRQKQIKILVYDSQNTPNNIQALITLAHNNNIPVATITETLSPATASFQQWQSAQLQGIESALVQATGK